MPAPSSPTQVRDHSLADELPAPGDYAVSRETWRQGPAFTMRAQEARHEPPDSPGEGRRADGGGHP